MDDEPVQAEVVEAYEEHEEEHRRRGPGIGPIIAIVVAVLLISVIAFYILYDPDVESIEIINPREIDTDSDGNLDSLEFEILATSVGPWRVDGTGKLEISIGGDVTYTGDIKVESDDALVRVPFNKFVTKNGNYAIRFSMEGKSNTNSYSVVFVPSRLSLNVTENYDAGSDSWYHSAAISPVFEDGTPTELQNYNKMYDITIEMDGPEGFQMLETNSMWVMDDSDFRDSFLVSKIVESDYMGFHDISARLVNKLVKEGSENREITDDPVEIYINRPPVITDVRYPSSIRTNEEVTFTVMASDPDRNDRPIAMTVFWDTENPDSEESDTKDMDGTTVSFDHVFTTSGDYVIYFSVADSGDVFSTEENYRKFNDTFVEIYVRGGILG
jgi:hypothetical protein